MKIISDSWRLILVLLVFVGVTCNPAVYEDIIWGHRGLEFDSIDEALNFHSKNFTEKDKAKLAKSNYTKIDDDFFDRWYKGGKNYWDRVEPTYSGMLGGYMELNEPDLQFTKDFLQRLGKKFPLKYELAIDCASGVGRNTIQILRHLYKKVDLVDINAQFIAKAKQLLAGTNARNFYVAGLQQFNFEHKYDLIWMSWVLAQLSNADVVTFMKKAKANLNEGGVIVLKENVNDEEKVLIDWEDHSVFRPTSVYSKLFKMAGLKILVEEDMPWPENMYGMRAYALG